MKLLTGLVFLANVCAVVHGGPFQKKEDKEKAEQAKADVHTGFDGLRQAAMDPHMLADVMESMKDPEIMAEAQKMMQDPSFQAEMKKFTNQRGFKDAAKKVKEQFEKYQNDPEAAAALTGQVEEFLAGHRQMRTEQGADRARAQARVAAGRDFGFDDPAMQGAEATAKMGLDALKEASTDPEQLALAMKQMKDPAVMREVQRLMADPNFAEQIRVMSQSPDFKEAVHASAETMKGMMGSK